MADNDLEVRFGGTTKDLNKATKEAKEQIASVGESTESLSDSFEKAGQGSKSLVDSIKSGFMQGLSQHIEQAGFNLEEFGSVQDGVLNSLNENGKAVVGQLGKMTLQFGALTIAAGIAAAAVATVFVGKKLIAWADPIAEGVEELDRASQKLNMSATELSSWRGAVEAAGVAAGTFDSSVGTLQKNLHLAATGGQAQSIAFKALKIDIDNVKTSNEAMLMLADRFSRMEDGPKKTALAMAVLGSAGEDLIPVLNEGEEALRAQMEAAEEYGATATDAFVVSGLAVEESMDDMDKSMKALYNTMFEALAPTIVMLVDAFTRLIEALVESYRSGGLVYYISQAVIGIFKILVSVTMAVATGFVQLYHVAVGALRAIWEMVSNVTNAVAALLSGDFTGAWNSAMAGFSDKTVARFKMAGDAGKNFAKDMQKLWGGIDGGAKPEIAKDFDPEYDPSPAKAKNASSGAADKAIRDAKRAAEERLRIALEELEYRQELAQEDFEEVARLEDAKVELIKEFYGENSREYIRSLRERERLHRRHGQDMMRIAQDITKHQEAMDSLRADHDQTMADMSIQTERQRLDALTAMGMISARERLAAEQQLTNQEIANSIASENTQFAIKTRSLRSQLELEGLGVEARRKILQELERLELEHQNRMTEIRGRGAQQNQQIQQQGAELTLQKWTSILNPIESAVSGMMSSLVTRSSSFRDAMINAADQVLISFLNMAIKSMFQWIAAEQVKTGATVAGEAARTSATAAGAAASNSITIAGVLKDVAAFAVRAAAGAYSAIASIPVVGPFLAPAAAAAALFGVMKLASSIFSAEGGWGEVPFDGAQTTLHKKEMVLPASLATPLRAMLTAGPQSSGLGSFAASNASPGGATYGDQNFYFQPKHDHHNARLSDLLDREGADLRKWLKNEVRNGRMGVPK